MLIILLALLSDTISAHTSGEIFHFWPFHLYYIANQLIKATYSNTNIAMHFTMNCGCFEQPVWNRLCK